MSVIKIDGVKYNVGEVALSRNAEIIYDPVTEGVMLDFSEVSDAVATKYTYSFTVEPRHNAQYWRQQYDAFYYDITSPKSIRNVELPFGSSTISFAARITTVDDRLIDFGGLSRWGNLTVMFQPVKPQRYGG